MNWTGSPGSLVAPGCHRTAFRGGLTGCYGSKLACRLRDEGGSLLSHRGGSTRGEADHDRCLDDIFAPVLQGLAGIGDDALIFRP